MRSRAAVWEREAGARSSRPTEFDSVAPSRLRVLHVTPYYREAWAYGGIPRVVAALAEAQALLGHAVTVCTTDAGTDRRLSPPNDAGRLWRSWPARRDAHGIRLQVFPNLSNRLAYNQVFIPIGLHGYLRRHVHDFDAAHLHAFRNAPCTIGAHVLHRAGVPYVVAPNGTAARIERRIAVKRVYDTVVGARLLRNASRVLAVSEAERVHLEALGVLPDRVRVIGNPIDLTEFERPPTGHRFRVRHGLGAVPIVAFLGKLTPRKRADVVVRAFAGLELPGVHLVLAGNEMGSGPEIRQIIQQLGIESKVHFTGLLAGRDRLDALAAADVVVYPSAHEIFGLVPLEALLCGRPVIVAGDSGCAEVLRDVQGTRTVPVGDVTALSRALSDGLMNPAWRAAAAAGGKKIAARYDSLRIARRVVEMYAEIVCRPDDTPGYA